VQFVHFLRQVADGHLNAIDATRAYHRHLQDAGIAPTRSLTDDLDLTDPVLLADEDNIA
jgi:hypothetical protein